MIKQAKHMPIWIGAFQVQLGNSLFYMNVIFMGMSIMTFWYTAGYQIRDRYLPWFSLLEFIGLVILVFVAVMILDYTVVLPARQAFQNTQACKHENPAMDALLDIQKDIKVIKEKLDIK